MRSRRGFLLAETVLKVVIALICIGFLISFLISLYYSKIEGQKLVEAENVLDRMNEIISDVNLVESEYEIPNPAGWCLVGFSGGNAPGLCAGDNCMCICPNDRSDVIFGTQLTECQENGKCLVVKNLKKFDEIEIKAPKNGLTNILIKKENQEILISEK